MRVWSGPGTPVSLERLDAGASVTVERGRRGSEVRSFGAATGLAPGDVEALARETAGRAHLQLPRRAPSSAGIGPDARGLADLAVAPGRAGGIDVSVLLARQDRRFVVGSPERAPRRGREQALQVEVRARGERRHRRAAVDVRVALDPDHPRAWARAVARAVEDARRSAADSLRAKPAPSGPTTVVLGPGAGGALFHEVLGHPLEADFVAQGRSWFRSAHVGRALATDELTIADDPRFPGSPVRYTVDDEGERARRVLLLDRGEWAGLIHDRTTASLAGVPPSGHGRRSGFRAQPRPRMSTTVVAPGPHRGRDLLASVARGVYVARISFGRADFVTGRFSMAVADAREIRGGKLGAPLAGVHLEGDALSFLAAVKAVGDDVALEPGALLCDKDDEVRVGLASPTVILHGVRVS